ncbi:MAG: NifU family protein [Candidatus Dependentiae bacterium]|jgi:Fe-S cluster biogenesis protein NfuA
MTYEESIDKIKEVIEQLRPNIQMDGGDVEFVKFDDGVVYVRFHGACIGCPAAIFTLKGGIEEALKEQLSDVVREVESVENDELGH